MSNFFTIGSKGVITMQYVFNPIVINSVTNLQAGDSVGTATTNGIKYNVYAFKTTGINYTINYTSLGTQIYVLAVGGGGTAYTDNAGGGGGGGVVMNAVNIPNGTNTINVNVGIGGTPGTTSTAGVAGNSTVTFTANTSSNIIAYGGGIGGQVFTSNATSGGSGGGAGGQNGTTTSGAIGNNTNMNYVNNGGKAVASGYYTGGGGGGAGTPGIDGNSGVVVLNGSGGNGIKCGLPGIRDFSPSGTPYGNYYWGGGGGGSSQQPSFNAGNGGLGGGGGGGKNNSTGGTGTAGIGDTNCINPGSNGTVGTSGLYPGGNGGANTGGGGGGGSNNSLGGNGGSGIIVIAFPSGSVVTINTGSLLTNSALSSNAYNNIKGAYGCTLLNYNYFGPIMCLRYPSDTNGINTSNFYSDVNGNLFTGPNSTGQSVSSWLSSNGTITSYAYVVKWYDQGMDLSFNNVYQYTTTYQPIYDVNYKVVNFGYTGNGGGMPTLQAGYLNLPLNAFPVLDSSFTVVTKCYNFGVNNVDTQSDLIDIFSNLQSGAIKLNTNSTPIAPGMWLPNVSTAGTQNTSSNQIITYKYTSFSTVGSLTNNYVIYQNSTQTGIAQRTNAITTTPQVNPSIGNNPSSAYANSGITTGTTTNYYLQAQLYYLYIFGTALTDADRAIIEGTTVATATPPTYTPFSVIGGETLFYPLVSDTKNYATGTGVSDSTIVGSINSNFLFSPATFSNGYGSLTKIAADAANGLTLKTVTIYQSSYSLSFWFYPSTDYGFLWSFNQTGQANYRIYIYGSFPSSMGLYVNNGPGTGDVTVVSPLTGIVMNQFNHFVWTVNYNGGSPISNVIINNGTPTVINGISYIYNVNTALIPNLFLNYQSSTYSSGISGKIAGFRFFLGTVLSSAQITTLYTNKI
jgi:hypothetical protein